MIVISVQIKILKGGKNLKNEKKKEKCMTKLIVS